MIDLPSISGVADAILQNQVATGVGAVGLVGGLLVWLRDLPAAIFRSVKRELMVEATVFNDDDVYGKINRWLESHPSMSSVRSISVTSDRFDDDDDDENGHKKKWIVSPGFGTHLYWNGFRPVWINRSQLDKSMNPRRSEQMEIRTVGRSQKIVRDIISKAEKVGEDDLMKIMVFSNGFWQNIPPRHPRSQDTVILSGDLMKRLVDDLRRFLDSSETYRSQGVPWKRGYLFSGPPGTGKTSAAFSFAGTATKRIYLLALGTIKNDGELISAFGSLPRRAVVIIEDVDCANVKVSARKTDDDEEDKGVSLSTLLNCLDGMLTPDGAAVVMTTNRPDKLDPALVRPGRVDFRAEFGPLGPAEQARMFQTFYGRLPSAVFPDKPLLPAALQEIFMANDPAKAEAIVRGGG